MATAEKTLVDRYLRRARDHSGTPYTKSQLVDRCEKDVSYDGPEARTTVQLKGVRGSGLKKHRRLIPTGPLGEIRYGYDGLLSIEFPSVPLLAALGSDSQVISALARYYTRHAEPPYPAQMTVELAVKFAHENLRVELDHEVIEALCMNEQWHDLGNGYSLICDMLRVEQKALEMRWKRVELTKWRAAGLDWPVLRYEPKNPRPMPPKPVGVLYRISERHAQLLRLFDQADEAGKQHIEQAGAFAAASKRVAPSN